MCFTWTYLVPSILLDTCWVNGIFLIFIDSGWREVSIMTFHWEEWDFMAAMLEISAGCCVCQRPISSSHLLRTCCRPSDMLSLSFGHLSSYVFVISLFTHYFLSLFLYNIQVVARDSGQSDRVVRSDASDRCCLSRREGQGRVGEGAGGSEEEGPQTDRNSKMTSKLGEGLK